jgi:predicted ester cyclase
MTPSPPGGSSSARVRAAKEVVRQYIARINDGDPAGLAELSVPKVRFVDAAGGHHDLTPEAWAAYFGDFPDYRIDVERMLSDGSIVAVFGSASGSYRGQTEAVPGAAWKFPAAWLATVQRGKVVEWRVFGDIEAMLRSAGQGRFR